MSAFGLDSLSADRSRMIGMTNDALISQLEQAAFWRRLAPQWSLGEGKSAIPYGGTQLAFSASDLISQRRLIKREGYLHGTANWGVDLKLMAQLVRKLDAMSIPPVFAFIYDAFWIPFFQLHPLIAGLLGGSYHMLPDCWIWNINPHRNQSGWAPHRDRDHRSLKEDGSPKIINIWLPLSMASPLNSCMYILPADRDPVYGTMQDHNTSVDLASVRALPAEPGDYLIWNQAVLHWGSRSSPRASESRVSMAWEFQRIDEPTYSDPILPLLQWPSFQDRLLLIAHQILHFASPGFFATVDQVFMDWAVATNPLQAQRRQGTLLSSKQPNQMKPSGHSQPSTGQALNLLSSPSTVDQATQTTTTKMYSEIRESDSAR